MTYPPQQPWPGGQGQPGPYGQPQSGGQYPPSGQQPGFGHPGQQHPGGQFSPSGPQPGFGQPGPQQAPPQQWGQQPGGYGNPGGFGGYPPPKRKSPLPWILGGGGALVVVIIVVVTLVATLGGGPGDPRAVAQDFVDKANTKQFAATVDLTCARKRGSGDEQLSGDGLAKSIEKGGASPQLAKQIADNVQFRLFVADVTDKGDNTAKATINGLMTIDMPIMGRRIPPKPMNAEFDMVVEDGTWKMCDYRELK